MGRARLEGRGWRGGLWRAQRARGVLEELALSVVEQARLQVLLLAELRDGDLVDVVATEDGGLLVGRERSAGFAGNGVSRCRFLCDGGKSRDWAGGKFALYRGLAALQHYVRVAHDAWQVDHFRRLTDGSWRMTRHGPGDRLDLDALGVTLAVDDLYDKVEAFGGPARTARPEGRPSGRVVVGA